MIFCTWEPIATLQGFGARYTALTHWREPAALLTLGRDLHDWLDGPEGLLRRLHHGVPHGRDDLCLSACGGAGAAF